MYVAGAALAADTVLVFEYWYMQAKDKAAAAGEPFELKREHYKQLFAIGTSFSNPSIAAPL